MKKKTARKSKTATKARKRAPKRDDAIATLERAIAAIMAGHVSEVPPTSIRRNRPEPKEAPAKAKAAMSDQVSGWERAFIASVVKAGGVTAKQQPRMDVINAKLKANGEPTINLPRRKKGDPTPGQAAKASGQPAPTKGRQALGRGFADIELTRLVGDALRAAPRGLTMGGLYDALSHHEPQLDYRGIVDAVEHLKSIGGVRETERGGNKVFRAA